MTRPPVKLKVIVVDDHPAMRSGIASAFSRSQDFVVIGEVGSIREFATVARGNVPDVVVVDIRLGNGSGGLDLIRSVKRERPETKFLVLTNYHDSAYVRAAMESGAHVYLLKDAELDDVLNSACLIAHGNFVFAPKTGEAVISDFLGKPDRIGTGLQSLSPRESQVLTLLVEGKTNDEIAAELKFSVKTVQGFLTSLYEKLGARNRTEAVVSAAKLGIITLSGPE